MSEDGLQRGLPRIALLTGSCPPHDVCGVGDYTFRLHEVLSKRLPVDLVHLPIGRAIEPELFRVLRRYDLVHVQYPTEGWGKSLLPGGLGLSKGRTKLLVTLHEWSEMNRLRRLSIRPLIGTAHGFVFVTPFERDAFQARHLQKKTWTIPIGVNLTTPQVPAEALWETRQEELKGAELLLVHFGFIHEAKQPEKVLDALLVLKRKGRSPRLIIIGGFQRDKPQAEASFRRAAEARGLTNEITYKGFVRDDDVAARLMGASDACISLFAEGVSSRRGSFWYALQHGIGVITTRARDLREFGAVADLLRPPHVTFVDRDASGEEIALAVVGLPMYAPKRFDPIAAPAWPEIAEAHLAIYRELLAGRSTGEL